jgi:hypothetical protein
MISEYEDYGGQALQSHIFVMVKYSGSWISQQFSINRVDRVIRLDATYVQLVGSVQPRFIQVPGLGISTLNPFAKLRADFERRTLNGLLLSPRCSTFAPHIPV